ncbi:MAG: hypothetical protein PHT83_04985 [Bacilli bacterium]|nr:hypothetical protein [Bacilli bacterium]
MKKYTCKSHVRKKQVTVNPRMLCFVYFLLGSIFAVYGFYAILFNDSEKIIFYVGVVFVIFIGIVAVYISLYQNQILVVTEETIILKNKLFEILRISKSEISQIEIKDLDTYSSGAVAIKKTWICIYTKKSNRKFEKGLHNKRKDNKLQLILNDVNYNLIREIALECNVSILGCGGDIV